ncbi:hypothetical protein A2U01_0094867, partial [Trifolium medium]|nr:hypothetical protein [Trifolium medium]
MEDTQNLDSDEQPAPTFEAWGIPSEKAIRDEELDLSNSPKVSIQNYSPEETEFDADTMKEAEIGGSNIL